MKNLLCKTGIFVLAVAAAFAGYAVYDNHKAAERAREVAEERLRRDLEEIARYGRIPLRERIGRMFIVGLDSCALKHDDPIERKIKDLGVGGVILFGYNIPKEDADSTSKEKLFSVCSSLRGFADYSLLIGTDQEGGKVMRLRASDGYPELPAAERLGTIDNEDTTRFYAGITAANMNEIGFNLNFAPCVDVNVNPDCPVIGRSGRSFSADPAVVAEHAGYYIAEHRKHGVLTAMKHFPGHGSSVSDSHYGLTDISTTWNPDELIPFKSLIDNDLCDMIMVGHIYNNQIDSLYPASLSEKTVEGLLRKELGWNGLVVSDDLGMRAIHNNYPLEESLKLCINAGVDMIMLIANGTPERIEKSIDLIERMVCSGEIEERRITESYRRIDNCLQYDEK